MPWLGDLEALYARWRTLGYRAQILGPHGSGKSTLLAHLVARARRDGVPVAALDDATVRSRSRVTLARLFHRRLLVTAHHDLGFATLCDTRVTVTSARAVVAYLLREQAFPVPSDAELGALLAASGGNLREALFALYDRFEAARRAAPDAAGEADEPCGRRRSG